MATAFKPSTQPPIHRGQRINPRARLNLPGRVMSFNGTFACTLIDLSQTGAKVGSTECPKVGSMVVIEGLPLELFGTVRWQLSGLFGFEFDVPVSIGKVIELRHYAEGERERQKAAEITYARNWVQGVF